MKKIHVKPPKATDSSPYNDTKVALEFLYEESIRNKYPELAALILQTIQGCDNLMQEKVVHINNAGDGVMCLKFLRRFLDMDSASRRYLIDLLMYGSAIDMN